MGTAIKNPVPDWVKTSSVIFDIWVLRHSVKVQTTQIFTNYSMLVTLSDIDIEHRYKLNWSEKFTACIHTGIFKTHLPISIPSFS